MSIVLPALAAAQQERPETKELGALLSGARLAPDLRKSAPATEELLRRCDGILEDRAALQRDGDGEHGSEVSAHDEIAQYQQFRAVSLAKLLSFAADNRGTEAALTAELIAARLCQGPNSHLRSAGIRMLNEIITEFPGTWQAKTAPFVLGWIIYDGDRTRPEVDRYRAAQQVLARLLSDPDATLPMDDPEVQRFLRFYQGRFLENPLRASALLAYASCEYGIAEISAAGADRFEVAKAAYSRVITEYPGSECARKAQQMLKAIELLIDAGTQRRERP